MGLAIFMKYLFEFGEGFLCFLPVFFVMAAVAAALLWNNLPSRTVKKETNDEQQPK